MFEKTILLVEDNADDEELTVRALKKNNVTNDLVVARDGVEALDYVFGTGAYSGRDTSVLPGLVLLDLKLPKIDGLEVLRRRTDKKNARGCLDQFERGAGRHQELRSGRQQLHPQTRGFQSIHRGGSATGALLAHAQ